MCKASLDPFLQVLWTYFSHCEPEDDWKHGSQCSDSLEGSDHIWLICPLPGWCPKHTTDTQHQTPDKNDYLQWLQGKQKEEWEFLFNGYSCTWDEENVLETDGGDMKVLNAPALADLILHIFSA